MAEPSPRLYQASQPSEPPEQPGNYGAAEKHGSPAPKADAEWNFADIPKVLAQLGMRATGPLNLFLFLMLPWLVFTLTMLPFALGYRKLAGLAWVVFAAFLAFSIGLMWWSTQPRGTPRLYWRVLGLVCGFMTVLGMLLGLLDYHEYIDSYRTYQNSRGYGNVLPGLEAGAFLDAGMISFSKDTMVDVGRFVSYQDERSYCVAPIVKKPDGVTKEDTQALPKVGFWAVGEGCCDEAHHRFSCGPVHDHKVHGGFVLMDPASSKATSTYPEYQRAIQKAAAQYDLFVPDHVLLIKWTADPTGYVESFWNEGVGFYRRAVGYFSLVSLGLFILLAAQAHKADIAGTMKRRLLRAGSSVPPV